GKARAPLHVAVADAEPRGGGRVLELPAVEVAVEGRDVVGEVRLQDVEVAVAVVVADGEAHPRLWVAELAVARAAGERHVREGAVAVVAVEDRGRRVAGHVEVGPAVAAEAGRGRRPRVGGGG